MSEIDDYVRYIDLLFITYHVCSTKNVVCILHCTTSLCNIVQYPPITVCIAEMSKPFTCMVKLSVFILVYIEEEQ